MKYNTVLQHISPNDKRCYSMMDADGIAPRRRLVLTDYYDEIQFESRVKRALKNEHTKRLLSTKSLDVGVLVVANNFGKKGELPTKNLQQLLNYFLLKNEYLLYPSIDTPNDFYKNLNTKLYKSWPEPMQCFEPDYISLYNCLLACCMKTEYNTVGFHGDNFAKNDFIELIKQQDGDLKYHGFGFDILVTDKFMDRNYIREILETNCKVVVCASSIDLDEHYIKELMDNGVQVVPSSLSCTGNFYVTEGLESGTRNIEESLQLTAVSTLELNKTIWHEVLNKRTNFYKLVEEIYFACTDENSKTSIKLLEKGIGTMSFKA